MAKATKESSTLAAHKKILKEAMLTSLRNDAGSPPRGLEEMRKYMSTAGLSPAEKNDYILMMKELFKETSAQVLNEVFVKWMG